ncbi:MAG: pilus assembly protein [Candidatus Anammoximicrobium sp.]|nr:pilus assembly protein [Candidatus Anammoximicrobium sp.]
MNQAAADLPDNENRKPAAAALTVRPRGVSARKRRGTTVVEFAVVAPVFILLVFGMIEFGRMVMVHQLLVGAVREGARQAVLDGATTQSVEQAVRGYLTATSIDGAAATVTVAPDPATAETGVAMTVETAIGFDKVSWLPAPMYLREKTLSAASTMRHE